ncbi:DUF2534 family protein [Scandinavium sp. V105_16]|uniref:DUF2534 family protein n=1 Tax=Scandinavium lactucae TaxID=3095028 RepID=A0AAJ2VZ41_9ENTR|nr:MULTISPECIES: DUF2534 family protein [unclassified Scandinavium]MDX6022580.1 DUF2534 family protein [Scandinavium sp. V105_16]MDX6033578.1 DUF2534 family protein [Scandinavium sp. V105_12]
MQLEQFKTKNGKRFILAVIVIFAVALMLVGQATFGGVVQEYDLPYDAWSTSMFIMQGAMVVVYSTVFTLLCSIPLGFILLEPGRDK